MKTLKLILLATLVGGIVNAQESQSTATTSNTSSAKVSDLQKSEEKEKDIDDEITNARQRAALGSKSKWSFKSALNYNGGSINKPTDEIRPNYRAGNTVQTLTNISGTVGINYRITERDSLSFGTGLILQNPFHGDLTRSELRDPRDASNKLDRVEVADPSLTWSRAYRAGDLQMVTSADVTASTTSDATKIFKQVGSFSLSQTVIAEMGTNLSLGASISADTYFHTKKIDDATQEKLLKKNRPLLRQELLTFGIYPFLEYAFNDRFQFRTVFGYFASTYYKEDSRVKNDPTTKDQPINTDQAMVEAAVPYQSMGIGIVITRDIYLYPNVQFTPLDIRGDRTNVALSTNINLF